MMTEPRNLDIAARLDEVALLLEQQGANPFRVAAYRRGATIVRSLALPVVELLEKEGMEGLQTLPGIGESLARSIRTLSQTGTVPLLERLRGESTPEKLLMTIPGIGHKLAAKLHDDLSIDSLEDLEIAAQDGRLRELAGLGEKKLAGIRDVLARRLGRWRMPPSYGETPSVQELLDVDREYRAQAQAGKLHRIAPRRFNPRGEPWLPVLHTRRGPRDYTALYSNTARAHQLGMTHDWVVVYCDDGSRERTFTVITARRGLLNGLRIVRGRENECAAYYRSIDLLPQKMTQRERQGTKS
jgi:DNA polymerase (family X)